MPPYDSDSSDDGEDYTETNTLLGYASKEASGDAISHLGGSPTWIDGKTAPSGALAKCKVCNGLLTLLLELHGDLPEHFPGHERRLYIWACRRKTCRRKEGSVRGIRGVRISKGAGSKAEKKEDTKDVKQEEKPQPQPQPQLGESLFGIKSTGNAGVPANPNPFSHPFSSSPNGKAPTSPFAPAASNPFASTPPAAEPTPNAPKVNASTTLPETFASKVRLSSPPPPPQPARPHEPWPAASAFPPAYPHSYLDADYETLDAPSTPPIPATARMDLDPDSSTAPASGGKEDKDVFESALDKQFQKFADCVAQNPEQVLRYEFNGTPLLYSDTDAVGKLLAERGAASASASNVKVATVASRGGGGEGMPRCRNCGADRVFEVQLTPHAITELEAEDLSIDGMEWGTIIYGACGRDCKPSDVSEGEVGYVEDWVGVQWEEVARNK